MWVWVWVGGVCQIWVKDSFPSRSGSRGCVPAANQVAAPAVPHDKRRSAGWEGGGRVPVL